MGKFIKELIAFHKDIVRWSLSGGIVYQIYLCILVALMMLGVYAYFVQVKVGLTVTNMSDIVSWGFYIANFTFLASAFAAGPALITILLIILQSTTMFKVEDQVFTKIRRIVVVAAIINLIMLFSEVFKEFYLPTHHSQPAIYLYFGLKGHTALVPWIWTAITMNLIGTLTLAFNPGKNKPIVLVPACILLFIGIWVEKGIGLIVPGLDMLTDSEWIKLKEGEADIGFAWVTPDEGWPDEILKEAEEAAPEPETVLQDVAGALGLDTGRMTLEQINLMLTHLPVDMTFVDGNKRVGHAAMDLSFLPEYKRIIFHHWVLFAWFILLIIFEQTTSY
jgi:hypothetical protein